MKKGLFIFLLLVIGRPICFSQSTAATGAQVMVEGHPRLLVQKQHVAAIRRNVSHADFVHVRNAFNDQKAFATNGTSANNQPDERIRQKMEAFAFDYLLYKRKLDGDTAVWLALHYLPSIQSVAGYWNNIYGYEAVIGAAIVYDWAYPLLTVAQKDTLIHHIKRILSITEYGYPVTKERSYFSGHYGEHGPTAFLAAGIAVYDEDTTLFDVAFAEESNFFAPSRNAWNGSGTHHQGMQYLHTRYSQEMIQAFILEKAGLPLYNKSIHSISYRPPYSIIPQRVNMDAMPEGDLHASWDWPTQFYAPAAHLSSDPFLQYFSKRFLTQNLNQSTRLFIYHNPLVIAKDITQLPLSRFFPSPSGTLMARTKWDFDSVGFRSNAVVVQLSMKEYHAGNHDHLDAGHFSVYYKGHLALDAGGYQGPAKGVRFADMEYGALHHRNYHQRTIAHNSVLIFDPREPTPAYKGTVARDGGQFPFTNSEWKTTAEMLAAGKSARILAHDIAPGIAPDYSYLKGDMTAAYNVPGNIHKTYPAKASTVRRSFVFLNHHNDTVPATLIVLDKVVSTNAAFKKTWLLHTDAEPEINGSNIIATRTDSGRNGLLHTTVMLPEAANQQIEKIGGRGKEFWVDGENRGSQSWTDAGHWRIELSPKEAALSDNFLTVMQVMDAKPTPGPLEVKNAFSEGGDFVAVEVSDRIVVQMLSLGRSERPLAFTLGYRKKQYKVLITDLQKGVWQMQTASGIRKFEVSDEKGTAYFTSSGGKFSLRFLRF